MKNMFGRVPEQYREAWGLIREGENVLIQGKAGTGKSTFIAYLQKFLPGNVVYLAPTGLAALNIGGQTIHSFAFLPPKFLKRSDVRKRKDISLYRNIHTVVIDEVSMVRADIFEALDEFLRVNRNVHDLPFGGVQVILVGDLFQLPPVIGSDAKERRIFQSIYEVPYFFGSEVFYEADFQLIEFEQNFRQKNDPEYAAFLEGVRMGDVLEADLAAFNLDHWVSKDPEQGVVTLGTTNEIVNRINLQKLETLSSREYSFEARVSGVFRPFEAPNDMILRLKQGAQVVFVRNDEQGRWVNGSVGRVYRIQRGRIEVEVGRSVYEIRPVLWEKVRYEYLPEINQITKTVEGEFWQYPIRLGWALTIHKSQGQTFEKARVDVGEGAFDTGQVYVALSRVTSSQGLTLHTEICLEDIRTDERVVAFLSWMHEKNIHSGEGVDE